MSQELLKILENGLTTLNLTVNPDVQAQLIQYITLLHKWNKIYNLTAVRHKKAMVSAHLLDSLAILPYITGDTVLDVGSGGGLPGIVLALCLPEKQFVLIDSNSKKTRFLKQAVTELKLTNVTVEHVRAESYEFETSFDQIVSRAYTNLQAFIKTTCHLATTKTEYLAMKGQIPLDEITELEQEYTIKSVTLNVPNVEGQRHLIIMTSK